MKEQVYATVMEELKECLVDARRVARRRGRVIPDPVAAMWWEDGTFFLRLSSPKKKNKMIFYFNEEHSTSYDTLTSALLEWY